MPHRFEPIVSTITTSVAGGVSMMASAILAILPAEDMPLILDNEKMRLICVIGAVGGGLLSALVFTPPKTTGRMFAAKVFSSSLAGIIFTPGLIHWLGWHANVDTLLALSAGVALIAIGAIKIAVPLWEKAAGKRFSPPDDPQPPTP